MKTISSFLIIVIAIFNQPTAHAQDVYIGFRGGVSIPNLTASGSQQNPLNTGYSSRLGPDAAVFVGLRFSKVFSIQPMIEYSSQGGKKDGLQAFPLPDQYAAFFPPGSAPTYLYANFSSEAKLNYLMIPVLEKFTWNIKPGSAIKLYVDAGPFIGFLLSAHQVTSGSSKIYLDADGQQPLTPDDQSFDNDKNIKDQLNKVNVGVEANGGLAYHAGNGTVFIEGGGNYGFLNIQKGTANGKNNTGAATITVGFAYDLRKKK